MKEISKCTNDFLFIGDIVGDRNVFLGDYDKDYALNDEQKPFICAEELMKIVHPQDREILQKEITDIAEGKKDFHNLNYRWIKRNGQIAWISCRGTVLKDSNGKPQFLIGRVSEEALARLYNPLSGLWNKEKLMEDLENEIPMNRTKYLMLFDINNLTAINLTFGRTYGDILLKQVAEKIEQTKKVSSVYHVDHKNFIAVIDSYNEDEVRNVFNEITNQMMGKCTFAASALPLDIDVFNDSTQVMDALSITLARAKNQLENSLEMFSKEEIEQRVREHTLILELKKSVKNNFAGFYLMYQPQVKSETYEIHGTEALLRYTSLNMGNIYPDEFIPLLEKTHLIDKVGMWVIEKAILQYREWKKENPDFHMSVNISVIQLEDPHIAKKIIALFEKYNVSGRGFCIELTETHKIHEVDKIADILRSLKEYGLQISIDDYGTGYANIAYLKQLEIDEVKIDRFFVKDLKKDTYNYNLIHNILQFAKQNNIRVCCEGVETVEELSVLESVSPNILQGYLFDRPLKSTVMGEKYLYETEEYKTHIRQRERICQEVQKQSFLKLNIQDVLINNGVGIWLIRKDKATDACEMYIGNAMKKILGIELDYTVETCYEYWNERIHPDYQDKVKLILEKMLQNPRKRYQIEYPWKHPQLGYIMLHGSGMCVSDSNNKYVFEGYHVILEDVEDV
ncbi:MAG: EAL domain-containing protein [Eubacteriales bacterium]|nr:EAL domain-containing protein [Eubacteriales bacterium]